MLIIEQLKHVFNELDIPVWISDENMQVTFFNKAWLALTGRSYADECNAGWLLPSPELDRERFINNYVAYFELAEPFEIDLRTRDFKGQECHLLLKGVPLFSTERKCKGYITLAYNQTSKILAEAELQKSERFYRALFEKSPVGILVSDVNGKIIDCNNAIIQASPVQDRNVVLEMNVLLDPLFLMSGVSSQFRSCIDLMQTLIFDSTLDFGVLGKRFFSYRLTPLVVNETCEGVLAFIEDVTEKKSFEEKVLQDHKLSTLGTLAAGIAHELNSPLGVVRLSCEMLKMSFEEDDNLTEHNSILLENILKSSDRMTGIIKQVMNYTRKDHEIKKDYFDLNFLIQEVFLMYGKILRTEDISVEYQLSERLPRFFGSETHMQTVVTDMISLGRLNLKMITKDKKLTLKTTYIEELNSIAFEVGDNGIPMPLDIKDRIFDPFFTTNSPELGPGLGLSITQSIIRMHGGTIGLSSQEGQGNSFRMLFPVEDET